MVSRTLSKSRPRPRVVRIVIDFVPSLFEISVLSAILKRIVRGELSRCQSGRQCWCSGGANKISRSEEHTSELQSLMRISYAVFCLKKKTHKINATNITMDQKKMIA